MLLKTPTALLYSQFLHSIFESLDFVSEINDKSNLDPFEWNISRQFRK